MSVCVADNHEMCLQAAAKAEESSEEEDDDEDEDDDDEEPTKPAAKVCMALAVPISCTRCITNAMQ